MIRNRTQTFETTIEVAGVETEVVVEYVYDGPVAGKMYLRNGDPGYPPEDESAEVEAVYRKGDASKTCIMDDLQTDTIERLFEGAVEYGRERA